MLAMGKVVVPIGNDAVRAGAAVDQVAAPVPGEDDVVAWATAEIVASWCPRERVVAGAAGDECGAADAVFAAAGEDDVAPAAAVDPIGAAKSVEHVSLRSPGECVCACRAGDVARARVGCGIEAGGGPLGVGFLRRAARHERDVAS